MMTFFMKVPTNPRASSRGKTGGPPWTQDLMSEEAKLELGML